MMSVFVHHRFTFLLLRRGLVFFLAISLLNHKRTGNGQGAFKNIHWTSITTNQPVIKATLKAVAPEVQSLLTFTPLKKDIKIVLIINYSHLFVKATTTSVWPPYTASTRGLKPDLSSWFKSKLKLADSIFPRLRSSSTHSLWPSLQSGKNDVHIFLPCWCIFFLSILTKLSRQSFVRRSKRNKCVVLADLKMPSRLQVIWNLAAKQSRGSSSSSVIPSVRSRPT